MSAPRLVIGADGTIGRALLARFRGAGELALGTTRRVSESGADDSLIRFDLREGRDRWPAGLDGGVAILCAGVTSLAACRDDPQTTREVNVVATLDLATRLVEDHGVHLVYLSSNLVFDGSAESTLDDTLPTPRTEYGRQKAEVEERLRALDGVAIVRLTKVIHPMLPLLSSWRRSLLSGESVSAYADQVMAPIRLDLVSEALAAIANGRHAGIWQLSGPEDISYLSFARQIAVGLGCPPERVAAASARAAQEVEHVPAHTALDTRRARSELKLRFEHAPDIVDHLLQRIRET